MGLAALRLLLALCLLGSALVAWDSLRHAIDHGEEAAYSRGLRRLETVDAELNHQLLESRAGLIKHYDALVDELEQLRWLQRSLAQAPRFLAGTARWDVDVALDQSARLLAQKAALIESFKTYNAVLRNSLHFLPSVAARVSAASGSPTGLQVAVANLLSAVLSLGVTPDPAALARLSESIAVLERLERAAVRFGGAPDLRLLLEHSRLIARFKPAADERLRDALTVPMGDAAAQLAGVYAACYAAALQRQGGAQRALLGLASASVALGLLEVILRLQRGRSALQAAGAELQRANLALAREGERERELGELKTRFVSMTSHEFRTPLSAILSSAELLESYAERWPAERRAIHLAHIKSAVLSMNQMLDQILVIGKAEAGMLHPNPCLIDLDGFCRALVETLESSKRRAASADGPASPPAEIQYRFVGPSVIDADELLLRHVLSNLLENAVKYSPDGGVVALEVEVAEGECRFVVRDQGIGIPQQDLPVIFESFRRGSNVGQISGSGLGMAVVQNALHVQHGRIEVDSAPGRGSEFRVQIPVGVPSSGGEA